MLAGSELLHVQLMSQIQQVHHLNHTQDHSQTSEGVSSFFDKAKGGILTFSPSVGSKQGD